MQKISSYLYPNRIQLLADLAGIPTEYTNVYQRTVKIYNGIDNTIEFDIKNADQKRIDLRTVSNIELNIMDASGQALPNSPYEVIIFDQDTKRGLAYVTIPQEDLVDLSEQYLIYSVTAVKDGKDVMLYGDTQFGATGRILLIGNAMPVYRDSRTYDTYTSEIDLKGHPTWHTSAIPATFYEAVKTTSLMFEISLSNLVGSIWIEGTKRSTINVEAFKGADYLWSSTYSTASPGDGNLDPITVNVGDYKYFRVSYTTPTSNGVGASFEVKLNNGSYDVSVRAGGTGYAVGSQIKVLGSVLGGVDGINDLIISVNSVEGGGGQNVSSYAMSSVLGVSASGTAASGGATYIVTGTNITGTVDKVVVS